MKRILCFIVSFALCLGLCPVGVWADEDETGWGPDSGEFSMKEPWSTAVQHSVENEHSLVMNGNTYTFTGTNLSAILVTGNGSLTLTGPGTLIADGNPSSGILIKSGGSASISSVSVSSPNGNGIVVEGDGSLTVTGESSVKGLFSFALNIASGAHVKLSGGTYEGTGGAIVFDFENVTEDDYAEILEKGYAFFDKDGNLLLPADMAVKTYKKLTVGECGHKADGWGHEAGALKHTCLYCGTEEKCSFTFDGDGDGSCVCGNTLTVDVNEQDLSGLVYDGTVKPENVRITVTLTDGSGTELVKDTDYSVDYTPQKEAGEVTVKVIGITFDGTFIKTFNVAQDTPGIRWDAATKSVDYDGSPVDSTELPHITITIRATEDLHPQLRYSYRKTGETEFTNGLPTNAGVYEVKAYLLESQNYEAAETETLLTLTIDKIPAVTTAPAVKTLNYNREAQELVTAGALASGAMDEGAVIEFATAQNGPYSENIPTGITVQNYDVWYRVADTENYYGRSGKLSARINHREITPTVELEYYTILFDGGEKQPKVTVKDGENTIPNSEYTVGYSNNRNVGTATVTVSNVNNSGNYKLGAVTKTFQITNKPQDALSITPMPNTVTYGDKFTLGTSGGSGNGSVTWEITAGSDVAEVDADSGQVTIIGDGSFTVQATKSGAYNGVTNYDDAVAAWTVTAAKKPVTATVTAENKSYDGDADAVVHATVEQGVLPGDEIAIAGLTGTFSDENAGANKTVTVDTSGASIGGTNSGHYDVTYSSLSVTASISKAVVHITTAPVPAALTYSGAAQALIGAGAVVDTSGVDVEYDLSVDGDYSTAIPEGTNAGAYTVWYRVKETDNYTGLAPASVDVTIGKKPVTPAITLDTASYVYDGSAKEPVVTLTEADGTIPADQYTVSYSDNVNVGTAAVTVTARADGNYAFTDVTESFAISEAQAEVLAAPVAAGDPLTFSNRAQALVTAGTGAGGTMMYSTDGGATYSAAIPTATDAGEYTVHYKVEGDGNHSDSAVGEVTVTITPKTVKDPTIELQNADGTALVSYIYDGSAKTPTVVVKDGSTVIGADEYNVGYSNNIDAGNGLVSITDKPDGNYTVTGSATFVINKAGITLATPAPPDNLTYNRSPQELLNGSAFDGGTIQYSMSQNGEYKAAIPTATDAGNYTVWYKVIGDKNHYDLAVQSVAVTIGRKELTEITIELSPESFAYDGTPKMPAVTVKDGKTVLPEEEYGWTCDVTSPTNVGTYTVTVSDKAGGNYDLSKLAPPANEATFTIGKVAQEALVIGGQPADTNYGDRFTLTLTGGSGDGAVTWSADGPASVDNSGNVTITGVGEVTVTAEKAADTNYLAAETQWSFTAAPRPVTAAVAAADKVFDGTADATVASASIAVISGDTVIIDPASITAVFDTPAVGTGKTVTLDASKVKVTGDDAGKYAISYPATVTADITQATTTIATDPAGIASLTYNGMAQALVTAGAANVGFIVYSLDEDGTYSTEIPTGTDAGTYKVYYKVDATADYTGVDVNTTPITVTIAPKAITPKIELSEDSYLYDGTKKNPTVTVKDGNTVIDEEQYTATWNNDLTSAGVHNVTISKVNGKNYTFDDATAAVDIVAATQNALKITDMPGNVCYGDTVTTLKTTGGSGNGTVKWTLSGATSSTINENTGVLEVKDTGELTVTAERTVDNYAPVSDSWTFTVEPKPVTAEVTVADKAYDGTTDIADGDITAEVKVGDLVSGDSINITGLKGAFADANVGSGKLVTLNRTGVTISCDTDKYAVSIPATAQADITPRAVAVTVELSDHDLKTDANGYFYTFNDTERRPSVTVTANDDGAALAASDYGVDYARNKNFGAADVTVTAKDGGNYTFTAQTVHFEIRKGAAALTATPQAKDLTYDGAAQDLVTVGAATGGTVKYSSDGTSYSTAIPQGTGAGTYTVYYMVEGDGNHDSTAPGQVSVTIKPKEITPIITLDTASYVYDGSEKKPAVTVSGGVDADPIADTEYAVSYRDNTNAGTATVTVSNANGGNYIVNGTATFEITKAAPAFTAPTGKTGLYYNGAPQELVNAGVCGDGTVVYSVNDGNWSAAVPTATAVGSYTIAYKVLGDNNHSDTAPVTLTVGIDKNTVNSPTISLSSAQFTFNGGQQKPTVAVYDDNSRLIPEHEYTVAITGVKSNNMIDVDTYTVTVTTPTASNYVITTGNTRTFEIVAANQETISITGAQSRVSYGDELQLGVTGGTGSGTVTWTVTDKDGSAVNSTVSATGLLTVKDVGGPITVKAERSAGGNYTKVSATWEFTAAKKQVTAVVTVADKPYDGTPNVADDDIEASVSGLVFGDTVTITGLTAAFVNADAGQNKTVNITGGPIVDARYDIAIPATTTASITAVAATVDTDPTANTLTYDASQAQALVAAGTVTGGSMVYSLDGASFTPSIPTARNAGTYTVWFKAQGDSNHTDSAVGTVSVTIGKQSVTPQLELSPASARYDGEEHKPAVTLRDGANNVIPASEYKVSYASDNGENWTDKGEYTVKIEDISGGNYVLATVTAPFTISATAQDPLTITDKPGVVHYGDTFTLSAVGGSGDGTVTWSVDDAGKSVVDIDANGFVTVKGTGSAVITATRPSDGNYNEATATYPLNAWAKPVTAAVTADDKVYDGDTAATLHVAWSGLVGTDTINTSNLVGAFADENVGTSKTVTITGGPVDDATAKKYVITIPGTTTASITKADMAAPAVTANDLTYNRSAQNLVSGGGTNTLYSDSRDGVYSPDVPTGTDAGTYTVWYKERGDVNHNDSAAQAVTVTISRKKLETPAITLSGNDLKTDNDGKYSYVYDGTDKKPAVTVKDGEAVVPASEYTVDYSDNRNVGAATVTVTCSAGGNYDFDGQTVGFEIASAAAKLTSSPQAKDLTYTGQAQELVTVGAASGGHIEYSLDGGTTYSESIPKGETAGTYTVTYKVVGDGNYADAPGSWTVSVTVRPKEIVSPKVTVGGSYTYDGNAKEPADADIKVEDGSTVIPGGEYSVSFRDNVEAGTATAVITNANGGNYIVNGTGSFQIAKADAAVGTAPGGREDLPYNGGAQALVTAGSASGGTMVYSLSENGEYSPAIPTGTAVGGYTVWYKVRGDGNHEDTDAASVAASIVKNTVTTPTVQVTPGSATWNGEKQEPTVTVRDDSGLLIDGSEYTVTFEMPDGNADLIKVGAYTLTITATGSNYDFSGAAVTETFEILPADQTPLTITGTREHVYYGDTIRLGTSGGKDSGTITWEVDNGAVATIAGGLLEIKGVGPVTVTATSKADGYTDQTATWSIYAEPKPVTAVVTAEARDYIPGNTTAAVTATLQSSDLVSADNITITLSGSFEDANAGTDKKVIVDSSSPDLTGSTGNYGNYSISYPATTTASIFKAPVTDVTAPTAEIGLEYTGLAQALVTAGSSTQGIMEYSTDNITYSTSLPTGADAGDYDVWYRVKGDGNHNDTAGTKLGSVAIAPQTVTAPRIEFNPTGASYDSAVHKPEVTVKDSKGRVIPEGEYTVTYGDGSWKDVGKYKVTIEDVDGGNYTITETEAEFEILMMGQSPLTITNQPSRAICYGDTFTLSAVGGSGAGTVLWQISGPASIDQGGTVKVTGSGPVTVTATRQPDGNYGATTAAWSFSAEKKPVKAIVTADDKPYDGNDSATIHVAWKDGDLVGNDTVTLELTGRFSDAGVGTSKTVTITGTAPASDRYEVTWNTTTTASITKAAAAAVALPDVTLTYNGSQQALVGISPDPNKTFMFSQTGYGFSTTVPQARDAGTYTVWYKVLGDASHEDSAARTYVATIEPKKVSSPVIELSPDTFDYDGSAKRPDVTVKDGSTVIPASEYSVGYSNNVNVGATAKVMISDAPGGNYIVSGEKSFTIKAAAAVLTSAPQERDLTYNGSAQNLVTKGSAVNGKLMYSLDDEDYSTTIPKGTDAGEYEVWYMVKGNDGYGDTESESITVTIKPKQVTPMILVTGSTQYTGSAVTPALTVIADGKVLTSGIDYYPLYSNNTTPGTATVTVISLGRNYQFATAATFEIAKLQATFTTPPQGDPNLVYTAAAQDLIKVAGTPKNGGLVVYSLDGVTYSAQHPTGTEVKTYTIYAKIQGNSTYTESDVVTTTAVISRNPIAADRLTVTLSPGPYRFTGSEIKPTVTLTDDNGNIIPADEYTVSYSDNTNVGEATVTVTSKGKNYGAFTKTENFQITAADAPALTITGQPTDTVYYGDTVRLGVTGGSGNVTWSVESGSAASQGNGQFKITGSGWITVKAEAGGSSDTCTFYAYAKPVTAIVTARSKTYDGEADATGLLTVTYSGLINGESISSVTAAGQFVDTGVGTQTVIVTMDIPDTVSAKYDISYPATVTASITPAAARVTEGKAPKAKTGLQYTGAPLELVDKGEATGGRLKYSPDGETFTYALPTGTDARSYTVWYKVAADDGNYKDSAVFELDGPVTIAPNTTAPTVECKSATFNATEQTPTVIVTVNNRTLPENEYTVTVTGTPIAVGEYAVTVTDNDGGNYSFDTPVTATFKIVSADQSPVSIVNKPASVCYGDTFRLSATGGSGNGAIVWGSTDESVATVDGSGLVKIVGAGSFDITAYRAGAGGYSDSSTDTAPFVADRRTVMPTVTAANKAYDGNATATLKAVWRSGDLVDGDVIVLTIGDGTFETADVGTNRTVTFGPGAAAGAAAGKYDIRWPESATASIYKVDAAIETAPKANPGADNKGLTYKKDEAQSLVTGGTTVGNIGTVVYSTSQNGAYSTLIPTGVEAGTYSVWYKVADSVNYTGIPAAELKVEIRKADPEITSDPTANTGAEGQTLSEISFNDGGSVGVEGRFTWKNGSIKPPVGQSDQEVIFTPDDTVNYNTVTIKIKVTVTAAAQTSSTDGSSAPAQAQTQTTVQNNTASTVLSASDGNKLVQEAAASQNGNVVIKQETASDVTKSEVSIPSATVSRLSSATNANLTVSSPVADVTIPNAALDTLGQTGGSVSVVTEQAGQGVALTLTSGGETVTQLPGGVKLAVPVEDASPGTVAVLVNADGTRETIRNSIVTDGVMSIPLSGSATVEIVDNSRDFDDVSPESWEADAVDFASSRELLSGTGETTFSPDTAMSRGMLATVLYRLEGNPDMELTDAFSDVGDGSWYADGVAWASSNGIAGGYGDDQFGPNDDVTREQFVVMLWRYAGSPEAGSQDLDFTDADQASGFAREALCWAVENGILNGVGGGALDPKGMATRAQAAQLLKNFMENNAAQVY